CSWGNSGRWACLVDLAPWSHRGRPRRSVLALGRTMAQVVFLTLLIGGIACLVCGLFVARQGWRSDIPPFSRRRPWFEIMFHPERYARQERLCVIRCLNAGGAGMMLCAVLVVGLPLCGLSSVGDEHGRTEQEIA